MKVRSNPSTSAAVMVAIAAGFAFALVAPASAQATATPAAARAPSESQLKRDTLNKMMRPVPDVDFQEHRLEDVINFITEITGADIEPLWIDDQSVDGLDKDALITLTAKRVSALRLLEMVLEKAADDTGLYAGGSTWQMTDWGSIECGPKERLAKHQRLEVYSIDDLLWQIPDYDEAPEIDLQSVLQSSQGGGGRQSPFQNTNQQQDLDRRPKSERAQDVIDIIEALVEPESWLSGGGSASIRYFQGSLLVRAPDYVHRQVGGYPWWPAAQTSVSMEGGRRYVSIGVDTGISTVDGFANQPVTATTGNAVGGGPGAPRPGPGG